MRKHNTLQLGNLYRKSVALTHLTDISNREGKDNYSNRQTSTNSSAKNN